MWQVGTSQHEKKKLERPGLGGVKQVDTSQHTTRPDPTRPDLTRCALAQSDGPVQVGLVKGPAVVLSGQKAIDVRLAEQVEVATDRTGLHDLGRVGSGRVAKRVGPGACGLCSDNPHQSGSEPGSGSATWVGAGPCAGMVPVRWQTFADPARLGCRVLAPTRRTRPDPSHPCIYLVCRGCCTDLWHAFASVANLQYLRPAVQKGSAYLSHGGRHRQRHALS